jgi:co-chaperonin GroES (HSP10)
MQKIGHILIAIKSFLVDKTDSGLIIPTKFLETPLRNFVGRIVYIPKLYNLKSKSDKNFDLDRKLVSSLSSIYQTDYSFSVRDLFNCSLDMAEGDTVYYYPIHSKPENMETGGELRAYFGLEDKQEILLWIPFEALIAVIKDNEIKPLGGHCFLEIEMETEQDIKTSTGLYVKSAVGKKPQRGKVVAAGQTIPAYSSLSPTLPELMGKRLHTKTYSDYVFPVNSVPYYVLRHTEVSAWYNEQEKAWKPYGYYCVIDRVKFDYKTLPSGLVIEDKSPYFPYDVGILRDFGNLVDLQGLEKDVVVVYKRSNLHLKMSESSKEQELVLVKDIVAVVTDNNKITEFKNKFYEQS